MKVFIIILHFGDPEVTIACLKSIFKRKISFTELVVIDNNQNLDPATPKSFKSKIKVIENKKNLGFSGGVNVGIRYALEKGADYVLLLNNDTIVKQNFLKNLIEFSEKFENAGIVGPAIKFKRDNRIVYDVGGRINRFFGRTTHKEVSKIGDKNPKVTDYISGCCMLVKKDVFERSGLFDERFFLYYEDVDFCLRARGKGFVTYVLPKVYIEHELSISVGKVSSLAIYHQTKSALLFGKKYFKKPLALNRIFIIAQSFYIFIKNPRLGMSAVLALKYI